MHYGSAHEKIPDISWDNKTVVWLDYDKKLNDEIIGDVRSVFERAQPGSIISVSVNIEPDRKPVQKPGGKWFDTSEKEYKYIKLLERINRDYIPMDTDKLNLNPENTIKVYRELLNNIIVNSIKLTNKKLPDGKKQIFKQVGNFKYEDGASMMTLTWVLYDETQTSKFESCGFENMPFFRNGDQAFEIEVPNLTLKEMSWLDSVIHTDVTTDGGIRFEMTDAMHEEVEKIIGTDQPELLQLIGRNRFIIPSIPKDDVLKYATIYRYFPTFAEAIL